MSNNVADEMIFIERVTFLNRNLFIKIALKSGF